MTATGNADVETVLYEERGAVRLLTINRPDRMNAIGPVESRGLLAALTSFRDDEEARVLVITGAGHQAFCAGADLHAVAAIFQDDPGVEPLSTNDATEGNIGPTRWTGIHKPIIAAVGGAAYAGGLEWACFAHLRIADQHASFGVTCRRWNVGLGDGGTQRLPRLIGMSRALDLIITGRVIGAAEARSFGLVNEVTPSGQCVRRALDLAETIAQLPQPALRTDLEAAVRGFGRPLEEGLAIEAECFNRLFDEPELQLGAEKFVNREHPDRKADAAPLYLPAKAYDFAERAHRDTPGKFGADAPFIDHPAGVASEVARYGDEVAVAGAYLHDTIEKTTVSADELDRAFGPVIRDLVLTLSHDRALADPDERRHDHRRRAVDGGQRARLIYAADRLDGIRHMSAILAAGVGRAEVSADQRVVSWRNDIEQLEARGLPSGLSSDLELAIADLEAFLRH